MSMLCCNRAQINQESALIAVLHTFQCVPPADCDGRARSFGTGASRAIPVSSRNKPNDSCLKADGRFPQFSAENLIW